MDKEGMIRGEHHTNKKDFLKGLTSWNKSVDSDNAFLCIYAHMGTPCICCTSTETKNFNSQNIISWTDLAESLPCGVALLWLLGYNSKQCFICWKPLTSPVHKVLLATSATMPWKPFIKSFAAEISLDPIRAFDEMQEYLLKNNPRLAKFTFYYRQDTLNNCFINC